jgi:anion-transporting  ArsA/GET3 family ATPase
VIVCTGSGGVGKTTLSATMGLYAARLGMKVLVLTIDPARRLADALGLSKFDNEPVLVPGQSYSGKLYAAMINPQKVFDQLVENSVEDNEIKQRIFDNRLYKHLSTTLNGAQEYTSLEKVYQSLESNEFDIVILDTPPTKHALDFLKAPEKFFNLFHESVFKWLIKLGDDNETGFRALFQKGTGLALRAFKTIVGAELTEELTDFFKMIHSVQPVLQEHAAAIHRLLTGPQTKFVLVTAFDKTKLEEGLFMNKELRRTGHSLGLVIVNRVFPRWLESASDWTLEKAESDFEKDLLKHFEQLKSFYRLREEAIEVFDKKIDSQIPIVRLADFDFNINSIEGLEQVADETFRT